ncbi:hypothetical protein BD410DRAFT_797058 [Rickenella mellea]|uniref:histidine kinase n=1 Tax=Rickenella mellea TaxID=50990 RepID=A0A4Y7PGT2_9AGAM|nr:hypothetical protein BD410DRAFT_797058 [Rickenella mellea]
MTQTISESAAVIEEDWHTFLKAYQHGDFPATAPPPLPLALKLNPPVTTTIASPLPPVPRTDHEVLDFFRRTGFLPAPQPSKPHQDTKRRIMKRFGLTLPIRRQAIDRLARIAKTYFGATGAVVSLIHSGGDSRSKDNWQYFVSSLGFPAVPGTTNPDLQDGFCTHTVLRRDDEIVVVRDTTADWRFANNPHSVEKRIRFYCGTPIRLPDGHGNEREGVLGGAGSDGGLNGERQPVVGSLCFLDPFPRPDFVLSSEDSQILKDLSSAIGAELNLAYTQARQQKEKEMHEFLGRMLGEGLVRGLARGLDIGGGSEDGSEMTSVKTNANTTQTIRPPPPLPIAAKTGSPTTTTTTTTTKGMEKEALMLESTSDDITSPSNIFTTAAHHLRDLLSADMAAIVHLEPFHVSHGTSAGDSTALVNGDVNPSLVPPDAGTGTSTRTGVSAPTPTPTPTPAPAPAPAPTVSWLDRSRCGSLRGNRDDVAGEPADDDGTEKFGDAPDSEALQLPALLGFDVDLEDGNAESEKLRRWPEVLCRRSAMRAISGFLSDYFANNRTRFDSQSPLPLSLQALLPKNTESALVVPLFDHTSSSKAPINARSHLLPAASHAQTQEHAQPALLIVLIKTDPYSTFEEGDATFATSVGAVLLATLLKRRIVEAAQMQTKFVSSISHELRQPLHAILSQIELIHDFCDETLLKSGLSKLIDTALVCGKGLRDILEDLLEFGKLTQARGRSSSSTGSPSGSDSSVAGKSDLLRLERADVEGIVCDVAVACLASRKAQDSVLQDSGLYESGVEVVVEVEERLGGWEAMVDLSGVKRILMNLIGNALKFTEKGFVKISLRELEGRGGLAHGDSQPNFRSVELRIVDSGIGMSSSFSKDVSLFTPFRQENSFAQGTGLGLSICYDLVRRQGGTLEVTSKGVGEGTTSVVVLPLQFIDTGDKPAPPSPPVRRRILSDEFSLSRCGSRRGSPAPGLGYLRRGASMSSKSASRAGSGSSSGSGPIKSLEMDPAQSSLPPPLPSEDITSSHLLSQPLGSALSRSTDILELPRDTSSHSPQGTGIPLFLDIATAVDSPKLSQDTSSPSLSQLSSTLSSSNTPTPNTLSPPTPAELPTPRVLVVDDASICRVIYTRMLKKRGIIHMEADNGLTAFEIFQHFRPTDVWMDLQMPICGGLESASMIRAHEASVQSSHPRCKITAVTGISNDEDMKAGLLGPAPVFDEWILKGGTSMKALLNGLNLSS